MIGFQITDQKDFTSKLFLQDVFQSFDLVEAEFLTRISISLDGVLAEPEDGHDLAGWESVRPLAFQILKGKELPHSFHIVLRLSRENTRKTLAASGLNIDPEEVGGLFLNIRYDGQKITAVTGTSRTSFSLDHSLDREWDQVMRRFFRHHQIPAEEL